MAGTSGIWCDDIEATIGHAQALLQEVTEVEDEIGKFCDSMEAVGDLGNNLEKILPVIAAIRQDLKGQLADARSSLVTMLGYLRVTQERSNEEFTLE